MTPFVPHDYQNAWLESRLVQTGYTITGRTGSALIATGHGETSFYVLAIDLRRARDELSGRPVEKLDQAYKRIGTIDGVTIFGDNVRLVWDAPPYRLLVQAGPTPADRRPSLQQITPIVRATTEPGP